ncbi:MAG TPA: [protein-PII] uridylyltransferase [Desulfobacteraceae bacterium]|mgnify:CR=1 FL=1|nr:[protein-PII] uridylyltransferase [Desulfobacteraceae bacterium]
MRKTVFDSRETICRTSKELRAARHNLCKRLDRGGNPSGITALYTEAVDRYFRTAVQESSAGSVLFGRKEDFAFIAVGGYGRKELCMESDIDLLILFDRKVPREARRLAEETIYPLWDLGLDPGYSFRTLQECMSLASNDYEVLTSLMDARFLCGDSKLYLALKERFEKKILCKKGVDYVRWFRKCSIPGGEAPGGSGNLMEPDLKSGPGGLRDYHALLWCSRALFPVRDPRDLEFSGILSEREYNELLDSVGFLLNVRNLLHRLSGRRNDKLHFNMQARIASLLGYQDSAGISAVERFLGDLHAVMASVRAVFQSFTLAYLKENTGPGERAIVCDPPEGVSMEGGCLRFISAAFIPRRPMLLLEICGYSAVSGRPLSVEARRLVREFLCLVDNGFRNDPAAGKKFLEILMHPYASDALEQMMETGLLAALIPEFGDVQYRVQFDAYHMFPVGRHLIETLRMLGSPADGNHLLMLTIYSEIDDPLPLLLAALFHDLGKVGPDHAVLGVDIVRRVLDRIGCADGTTEDVLFLVRRHLLLAKTATRRDLGDEKVVVQCACALQSIDRLKMLYLLTWADSAATGSRAWNPWKAALVEELFFKVLHILERGELAGGGAERVIEQTRDEVKKRSGSVFQPAEQDATFEIMPPRYLLTVKAPDICRHLELHRRLRTSGTGKGRKKVVMDAYREPLDDTWQVVFAAEDRAGLFADLAGVLTLNDVDVLSASAYTWGDGTALDIFRTGRLPDALDQDKTWRRVNRDLEKVVSGQLVLSRKIAEKRSGLLAGLADVPPRPPRVVVDNGQSDFFTIVEVFADDKPGILFDLADMLFRLNLDIRLAKIATHADQIADIFYVCDIEGGKVEEPDRIRRITDGILQRLGAGKPNKREDTIIPRSSVFHITRRRRYRRRPRRRGDIDYDNDYDNDNER